MEVVIGHIGRDRAIEEVREKRELREAMRRVVKLKGSAVTVSGSDSVKPCQTPRP